MQRWYAWLLSCARLLYANRLLSTAKSKPFAACYLALLLPDASKWQTSGVHLYCQTYYLCVCCVGLMFRLRALPYFPDVRLPNCDARRLLPHDGSHPDCAHSSRRCDAKQTNGCCYVSHTHDGQPCDAYRCTTNEDKTRSDTNNTDGNDANSSNGSNIHGADNMPNYATIRGNSPSTTARSNRSRTGPRTSRRCKDDRYKQVLSRSSRHRYTHHLSLASSPDPLSHLSPHR